MDYPLSKATELRLEAGKFKDRAGAVKGSVIPATDWANPVTDEIIAVITEAGLPPTEGQNDQLRDAILAIIGANPSTPRGFIDGLTLSNNGADAAKDIDIAAGVARDGGDAADMVLAATLVKQIDASWAVGTNQGGLDGTESVAGTPDADTWYHVWLIRRSDTGVVDVLFSESATAPTMPADYDQKRRIGAVLTDATPDIIAFFQDGDVFRWDVRVLDESTAAPGTSGVLLATSVPLGIKVDGLYLFTVYNTATGEYIVTSPDETDTVPTTTMYDFETSGGDAERPVIRLTQRTNTSSQIRYRSSDAALNSLKIFTLGWIDPRGRNA